MNITKIKGISQEYNKVIRFLLIFASWSLVFGLIFGLVYREVSRKVPYSKVPAGKF